MTTKEFLSLAAGVIGFTGYIPYIISIIRGRTKPAKVTWLIWATLDVVTLTAMYLEGALNGPIVAALVGASVITVLSFRYGTSQWTALDKVCLTGTAIGVIFLKMNPLLALSTSLGLIFLGSIPTFVSAWKDPARENLIAWTIFSFSALLSVVAIPMWTLANAEQPLTFLAINGTILSFVLFRPRSTHAPVVYVAKTIPR